MLGFFHKTGYLKKPPIYVFAGSTKKQVGSCPKDRGAPFRPAVRSKQGFQTSYVSGWNGPSFTRVGLKKWSPFQPTQKKGVLEKKDRPSYTLTRFLQMYGRIRKTALSVLST